MRPPIRAFIAIELDARVKRELARVQDRLKTAKADVKWSLPANIHLTLKFLLTSATGHPKISVLA